LTALACLRVDVSAHSGQLPMSALGPLVQKFTMAYLDMRWSWPRQFTPLTEVSFLLTDPRADELDVGELRKLSDDLQTHLFGAGDEGAVALLVFEGPHEAVTAFAAMDAGAVAAAVADPARLPAGGRLTRIMAGGQAAPPEDDAESKIHWVFDTPAPPPPAWEGVQGVYFIPREVFFADIVMYMPLDARTHLSLVDGVEHLPKDPAAFDAECLGVAVRYLAQRRKGPLLYLPISFTSLVRPSLRHSYEALLADLPKGRRGELAVSIYDVPRDPTFAGLRQAKAMLEPYFSTIDLRTSDPNFEIEKLPAESVNSVTLILPEGDPLVRLSALRRFGERIVHYKQRRIWPAVSNVRRRAELEAAARLRIPFVTGPAICPPMATPVGGRTVAMGHLPLSPSAAGHLHNLARTG
jgi:hypothetical protein